MLVFHIILAIVAVIAVIIFAVKAANLRHQIEDIYAKQAILHDKYCHHEDRIDGNYKSLAELNRRQDEWERQHNESDAALRADIKALQDYNAECERKAKEVVEEFEKTINRIAEKARKVRKAAMAKETPAKEKSKAPEQPATDPRYTRNDVMHIAEVNRERFAVLRKTMSVREAAKALGVSLTTAKRYEKWRKAQEQ